MNKSILSKIKELEDFYGPKPGDKFSLDGREVYYLGKDKAPTGQLKDVLGFKTKPFAQSSWDADTLVYPAIKKLAADLGITRCTFIFNMSDLCDRM